MKKSAMIFILGSCVAVGCQQSHEEVVVPQFQENNSQSFIFRGNEVDSMIHEKLGVVDLQFADKMRFLSKHIAVTIASRESQNLLAGRVQVHDSFVCTAGVWDEAEDEWVFNSDHGLLTELVSASKTIRRSSPYMVGASASMYLCTGIYCDELYDIKTVYPQTVTCNESDVEASAHAWRSPSGYTQLNAFIGCDD